MFLRGKKPDNNLVLKQPKEQQQKPATKQKALGGWEDEEQDTPNTQPAQQETSASSGLQEEPVSIPSQPNKKDEFKLYTSDELSEQTNIEYETKQVNDITQPGGIRVKPNENQLSDFSKAARTLDVPIIGSLLVSKLQLEYPYALKAKALYTMEYIAKKIDKYQSYFKRHSDYIRSLPLPEDNQQQYQALLDDTLNSIQGVEKSNKVGSEGILEFTDPGYNVSQKPQAQNADIMGGEKPLMGLMTKASDRSANKPNKGPTKTFISPQELKKKKQMEETKKSTEPVNILELNTPNNTNTTPTKHQQPTNVDIFSLEGLKITDKPVVVPIVPQVPQIPSVPQTNSTNTNQFNLFDPKQLGGFQPVAQPIPNMPPQNQQQYPYAYMYPYGVAPMQPMQPMGPMVTNYAPPQYPINGAQQYPVGGYTYGPAPINGAQKTTTPSKPITGDNLYSNLTNK